MIKESKRGIKVFVIIFTVIILSILALWGYASYQRTILHTYVEDISSGSYKTYDFYVQIQTGKKWIDKEAIGAQYDGSFYNNTNIDIVDWHIDFTVPKDSRIDSDWNGVYKKKKDHIIVTALDYNKNVKKTKCETFGLVMYTDKEFHVNDITVSGYKDYRITNFIAFWILLLLLSVVMIVFVVYLILDIRMRKMQLKQNEYKSIIMQSLKTFANIIDAKDSYTSGHSLRVAKYAQEISRRMGKSADEQERIFQISLIHDIGKIAIDNKILNKPGKLTPEERRIIQQHTITGGDILKDFTTIQGIEDGARYHHESFDGSGYPAGLVGKAIPECARIICVADAFDAMNSDRCYRKKLSKDAIRTELERCSDIQFDGEIARHVLQMMEEGFTASEGL